MMISDQNIETTLISWPKQTTFIIQAVFLVLGAFVNKYTTTSQIRFDRRNY